MRSKVLLLILLFGCAAASMDYGHFDGTVKVEWLRQDGQDRKMKLLEDFSYVDPKGKMWTAKKGYETDGASIPKVFWSFIGGPFEGPYREAAVIHDWYCDKKTEPWKDVHRIFYYASRASGVPEVKAKVMYAGVRIGGPKWGSDSSTCYATCHALQGYSKDDTGKLVNLPILTGEDAEKITKWVEEQDPSLEEIDKFAVTNFRSQSTYGHELLLGK